MNKPDLGFKWPNLDASIARSLLIEPDNFHSKSLNDFMDAIAKRIMAIFPEANLEKPQLIDTGWDNLVIAFDRKYVFKIPRSKRNVTHLMREINLLEKIEMGRWNVPRYIFLHRNGGLVVAGYEYIEGIPISGFSTLSSGLKSELRRALDHIHSVPIESLIGVKGRGLNSISWLSLYGKFFKSLARKHASTLGTELYDKLISHYSILKTKFPDRFKPVLIHGDFYRNNILVDPQGAEINGILDWGDAIIGGDPALDMAAICMDYGDATFSFFTEPYLEEDPYFADRTKFYMNVEPLIVLDHARSLNDRDRTEKYLAILENNLTQSL